MLQYIERITKEKGQGMVEYGVILAVVVVIGVALLGTGNGSLADKIKGMFTTSIDAASNATTKATTPSNPNPGP